MAQAENNASARVFEEQPATYALRTRSRDSRIGCMRVSVSSTNERRAATPIGASMATTPHAAKRLCAIWNSSAVIVAFEVSLIGSLISIVQGCKEAVAQVKGPPQVKASAFDVITHVQTDVQHACITRKLREQTLPFPSRAPARRVALSREVGLFS